MVFSSTPALPLQHQSSHRQGPHVPIKCYFQKQAVSGLDLASRLHHPGITKYCQTISEFIRALVRMTTQGHAALL